MKKIMLSAVILMPLIVLMIMLVSGVFLGRIENIPPDSIEFIDKSTLNLIMSDENNPPKQKLEVNVLPMSAKDKSVKFTSLDENIVTVDENGVVTAVDFGETYVVATTINDKSARRLVRVTDTKVHRLELNRYPSKLYKGYTYNEDTFTVAVIPSGALNTNVSYISSNTDILEVAPNGTPTVKGYGKVTLTVKSVDNPSATQNVEIDCRAQLSSLLFVDDKAQNTTVTAETTAKFPAVKFNDGAEEKITYSVAEGDEEFVSVDEEGNILFFKEGKYVITASAIDGLGNEAHISKTYVCTNEYYMGNLFAADRYTFDFDEYIESEDKTLPIEFGGLEGANLKNILDVQFYPSGIISYDQYTGKFTLTDDENATLGDVQIVAKAKKYVGGAIVEAEADICRVSITRAVKTISFEKESIELNFDKIDIATELGLTAAPANHTAKLSYEIMPITEGCKANVKNGLLVFENEGSVRLTVTGSGISSSVSITYYKGYDGSITIDASKGENFSRVLRMGAGEDKDIVVGFKMPNGTESISYSVSENGVLEHKGDAIFTPIKGGFETITISAIVNGESKQWTVNIFVDKAVDDVDLTFGNVEEDSDEIVTSLDSYGYTVTLKGSEDAMAGKELIVTVGGVSNTVPVTFKDGKFVYNGTVDFAYASTKEITAALYYTDNANECGSVGKVSGTTRTRMVKSTCGGLDEYPEVIYEKGDDFSALSFDAVNDILISNLGRTAIFTIYKGQQFKPNDFELTGDAIRISDSAIVDYTVSDTEGGTKMAITLTGRSVGEDEITLTVGGMTYRLKVTVKAKADSMIVKSGNITFDVESNIEYVTLNDSVSFNVKLGSTGGAISNYNVKWTYMGKSGIVNTAEDSNITIDNISEDSGVITFESADRDSDDDEGPDPVTIKIKKVNGLDDFGIKASYSDSQGRYRELETYESLKEKSEAITYTLPAGYQGVVTFTIIAPSNMIGGFGARFNEMFELGDVPDAWDTTFSASNGAIIINPQNVEPSFIQSLTISHGNITQQIVVRHVDIRGIESTGYDMLNKEDVYLGYQQARVFAKHSYYNGTKVDYYKIPFEVEGTKDFVKFDLSRYVGDAYRGVISTQIGKTVTYGDATFTVEGDDRNGYKLMNGNQEVSGIAWVDIYSEPGYARIYFGDFGGLTESDVQNDYFGNFGDEDNWSMFDRVVDDKSGRNFEPSENAGAFLRVEASDGVMGSVSWHYNFNILEGDELVNIDDADGFINGGNNLVLQHSLYAPGENDYAEQRHILNIIQNPNIDHIYGNGFQINFKSYSDMFEQDTGNPLTIWSAYNVVLKGETAETSASYRQFRLYVEGRYFYYCDIQCMYRGVDDIPTYRNDKTFVKNSIIRYALEGIYMNDEDTTVYIENLIMIDVLKALNTTQLNRFYIKGFVDILNYYNRTQLISNLIDLNVGTDNIHAINAFMDDVNNYTEWFGYDGGSSRDNESRYVNLALLGEGENPQNRKNFIWNEETSQYEESLGSTVARDGTLKYMAGITVPILDKSFSAWSYDSPNDVDGGIVELDGIEYKTTFEAYRRSYMRQKGIKDESEMTPELEEEVRALYEEALHNGSVQYDYKVNKSSREMTAEKLFTDERYIRLLCQYKGAKKNGDMIVNAEHINWHMERIYRDHSKVGVNGWSLDDHIDNLKASLAGTKWGNYEYDFGSDQIINNAAPNTISLVPATGKTLIDNLNFMMRAAA